MRRATAAALCLVLAACGEAKEEPPSAAQEAGAREDHVMAAAPDFDALWNYADPAATREAFTALLAENPAAPAVWQRELQTQIARTYSLVGEFDAAHETLDAIESQMTEQRTRIRYLLERGRAFNSAGNSAEARPLFVTAYALAMEEREDFFAVDAAHMVAIVDSGTEDADTWAERGLDVARASEDPRAQGWVGPLTNNMGWEAFDRGDYAEATALFMESRDNFLSRDLEGRARIARWSLARVLRAEGKVDEALSAQLELLTEHDAAGTKDGFVHEELAELYLLKGDEAAAIEQFALALPLLEQERWFVAGEPERYERVRAWAARAE